ncbi:hypothetical protein HU200_024819 [Digitaria exilis]|uniref:RNase H type-1 domain-containing protein n=1 Tax=Digitaria exilis TaxID=1010633 RepID=A0A835C3K2_9POAL|nr:hypothetical protein HU200_024819 [Digitaria exilis]
MWSLWMQCNKRRHGEDYLPIQKVVDWVRHRDTDLWHIMHTKEEKNQRKLQRWKPPKPGWIKCNVDGAFNGQANTRATGVVLRDHTGLFKTEGYGEITLQMP